MFRHPHDFRFACASSHNGTGAGHAGSHHSVRNTIGQRAAPTFFWGEETSPGRLRFIADRLILMGDWRDSDRSQRLKKRARMGDLSTGTIDLPTAAGVRA